MTEVKLIIDGTLSSNPDFIVGSCVTLYREDGRSLWKQRFLVCGKGRDLETDKAVYHLKPVEATFLGEKHDPDELRGINFAAALQPSRKRVRVKVIACPSCKQTHPIKNFNHACPTGKWCSAVLCDGCGRIIDGNEAHFCPGPRLCRNR